MKIKTRTTVLLIAIGLGGVLLAVTAYASVTNILALGTIPVLAGSLRLVDLSPGIITRGTPST